MLTGTSPLSLPHCVPKTGRYFADRKMQKVSQGKKETDRRRWCAHVRLVSLGKKAGTPSAAIKTCLTQEEDEPKPTQTIYAVLPLPKQTSPAHRSPGAGSKPMDRDTSLNLSKHQTPSLTSAIPRRASSALTVSLTIPWRCAYCQPGLILTQISAGPRYWDFIGYMRLVINS